MGTLFSKALAAAVALALLTAASEPAPKIHGRIPAGAGKPPVNWEARSSVIDYQTQHLHLRGDVRISQGEISVESEDAEATATSKDSRSSHWVFSGKVHVRAEGQGELHADHATVEILNGQLASALVTGSPAQFQQTRSTTGRLVRGHATTIDYVVSSALVKLTGDAFLTDDQNENDMKACQITYNVRDQQIRGESDRCPDVKAHMTIMPRSNPGSAPAAGSP
ncbi:MAG TPA: LptA/OstA family protein [Steroidobacteraceae bacterium]|nr:LptA/OstA family protein [Steroidobacteraceae bacterium]